MKTLRLIPVFLLTLAGALQAQQAQQLTLAQAIDVALTSNRDLKVSRLDIDQANAQVKDALGNALPSLTLNGRYTDNLQLQVFYIPGADGVVRPVKIGAQNAVTADVTLNQIVFNSAVFTGVKTSEIYGKISRQQLRAKTADIVMNVKKAYYDALLARELLKVNETLLANAEENFNNTKQLTKSGVRAEFDALRAEVQFANQKPVVVQSRDNYELALDNLRILLGYNQPQQIELVDPLVRPASSTSTSTAEIPQLDEAIRILHDDNPSLQALSYARDVNEDLIKVKKSDYLPTVSLFGTYQFQAQADKLGDLDFQPVAYVGLNLSMNLFNGRKTDAQVSEAEVSYEQSKLQLDQLQHGLETQVEAVLRRIGYARERINATDRTIEQAERGYQIATTSYKAGTGTQLQINDADLALAQSKWNQLTAVHDYYVGLAELEQLLGQRYQVTPDGEDVRYSLK